MKTAEALLSVKFNTSLKLEELNEFCQADLIISDPSAV
jgi:hypothetical protein